MRDGAGRSRAMSQSCGPQTVEVPGQAEEAEMDSITPGGKHLDYGMLGFHDNATECCCGELKK